MNDTSEEKLLNETVVKLGMVSLFADIASEMLYPITPIFLTTVLGASMASVGFIEGTAEAIASLLKAWAGLWSDRTEKRKPFVWGGYLLSALAKPLTGAATTWPVVLMARGLDRVGKGFRGGPRDALLSESVAPHLRGAAFGWHRAMDTLGAAIGPLLAIWYLQNHSQNLREIYFYSLIPGVISVLFALSVREKRKAAVASASNAAVAASAKPTWQWSLLSSSFKKYLFAWGVFSLANSSDVFLLMKAKQEGLTLTTVILLYCFYNLVYALLSPYLGGLSDKLGRKVLLIFGLVVFAIVYVGFSFAQSIEWFWILFGVYGIYMAATDGVGKAMAIDLVPKDLKATGIGVLGTVTGLATLFASTFAGFLWDHYGASSALIFGAIGACLSAILLTTIPNQPSLQK
jgi:MFS family permease